MLPIPGLWHVQLNFLYMVMCMFYRNKKAMQQFSALYTHINHLRRHSISREKALFYYMEKLILQSFDTCIVALFLFHICNKCNIKADGKAEQYMQNLFLQQFLEHVENICTMAFLKNVCRDVNQYTFDHLKPPANACQSAVTSSSMDTSSFAANNQIP